MLQFNSSSYEFFQAIKPETIVSHIERSVRAGETSVFHNEDGTLYVFYNKDQNGVLRQNNTGAWYFSFTDSLCNYACAFDTVFEDDAEKYKPLLYRLLVAFAGK